MSARSARSIFQIAAGLDQDGNYLDGGEQEAKFLASASWHERKRYETLKREFEKERYRRRKAILRLRDEIATMEQTPDVEPDDHAAYQLRAMAEEAGVELGGSETTDELAAAINDARRHKLAAKRRELAVEEKTKMRPGERICLYCRSAFEPDDLRQHHCKDFKPGNPNYCRQMAWKARAKSKGGTDPL